MLYAYVLMTKPDRDYATAETQLKDIMNMGYELLPNYADIYDTSKRTEKNRFRNPVSNGRSGTAK